jgi:hypothetical protein
MKKPVSLPSGVPIAIALLRFQNNRAYAVGASTPFMTFEAETGSLAGGGSAATQFRNFSNAAKG